MYGKIVDTRINPGKSKMPPGKGPQITPSFGFITFDNADAVRRVLAARPITIDEGAYRLNVEEKKNNRKIENGGGGFQNNNRSMRPSMGGGRGNSFTGRGGRGGSYNPGNIRR